MQDLLGHKDVATTQFYTHVMQKPGLGVRSPLDGCPLDGFCLGGRPLDRYFVDEYAMGWRTLDR